VPSGGASGYHLAKIDATDYNTEWTGSSAGASGVITGAGYNVYVGASGGDLEFRGITSGTGTIVVSGASIGIDVNFSGAPTYIATTGTLDSGSATTAARSDHTHALDSGLSGIVANALTGFSGVITGGGKNVYVGMSGDNIEFRGITSGTGTIVVSGTSIGLDVNFSGAPTYIATTGTQDSGSSTTAARSDHTHALDSGLSGVITNALTGFSGVVTGGGKNVYAGMSGDDIELRGITSGTGTIVVSGASIGIDVNFSGAPTYVATTGTRDSGSSTTAARSDHTHAFDSGASGKLGAIPSGGSSGFALVKSSSSDYATEWAGRDFLSVLANAEVTITDSGTGTIGKLHVVTGGGYPIYLPPLSGSTGKQIAFRFTNTASGIYTLSGDGNSIISPRGSGANRQYVKTETCTLYCDGTIWHVISETMLQAGFMAYQSGQQTITGSTASKIICEVEVWDHHGWYDSGTFTPKAPGTYAIGGIVSLTGLSGNREIWISFQKNSSGARIWPTAMIISTTGSPDVGASLEIALNGSTDYVDLCIYHNSAVSVGTATTSSNGGQAPRFWASRIRRETS
jgi:hypothetical protein